MAVPMIEHMIDPMRLPDRGGVSVEAALRGLLAGRGAGPVVELAPDFRAHGRQPVAAGPGREEEPAGGGAGPGAGRVRRRAAGRAA